MNTAEINIEDLIAPQDMVVTLSHTGYFKRQPLTDYRAQKRGGRGKQAAAVKDDDFVDQLFVANTHDHILCFSNRGRLYWLKVYEVPEGNRNARGKPIVNLFPLLEGEKITAVLPVKEFDEGHFIFMATAQGTVKKTPLTDFANPRKAGIIAVGLDEGDYLVGVAITDGQHDVMMFSDAGKAVRFSENDVRPMGRQARGVRGMMLEDGQTVIAMLVASDEEQSVLTATENGFGKRTPIGEYTRHGRGTKGMIAIQTSDRNGKVVAATLVTEKDQIMLITTGGVLVRTRVSEIREMGRATQGVTLISVDEGSTLSGVQKILEGDEEDHEDGGERRGRHRSLSRLRQEGFTRCGFSISRPARQCCRPGARTGARRTPRLARPRHEHHGDEPPGQGFHRRHRRGRGRPARADGHPGQLQGALPAGRGDPAVRPDPDEPAGRPLGRLRAHRFLVQEGLQGGPAHRQRAGGRLHRGRPLHPRAARRRAAVRPQAAYAHICTNETIHGVEMFELPELPAGVPLVADMSSHILSRPMDVALRPDLRRRAEEHRPGRPRHRHRPRRPAGQGAAHHAERDGLCHDGRARLHAQHPAHLRHLPGRAGVQEPQGPGRAGGGRRGQHRQGEAALQRHRRQRRLLRNPVEVASRSRMNVPFTLADPALDADFLAEAAERQLSGLKGHKSVGGMRASIYNAMTIAGVEALVDLMQDFAARKA
jgi:hypothetical protein